MVDGPTHLKKARYPPMSDNEIKNPETQPAEAQSAEAAEKKSGFSLGSLFGAGKKDETGPDGKKKKKTWQQELTEWIVTLVVALVIAFVVRSFLFEPVYVDGNSMFPTLRHGEIMYVSKTSYGTGFFGIPFTDIGLRFAVGGDPERFDVVVCHYEDKDYNVVKRVVGLPGDTVQLIDGYLYVTDADGRSVGGYDRAGHPLPVDEDFIYHRGRSDFGPVTVPEGEFFLMGDNRTNSLDSRDKGPVSRSEIVGKVEAVIWHGIPNRLDDQYGLKTH